MLTIVLNKGRVHMIKVDVFEAKSNISMGKNATFLEGELYNGRMSKDGNRYVLLSEEGYWIPIVDYTWARSGKHILVGYFTNLNKTMYYENYKELKLIGWM